ncbi:MAG: trp operon repressor [Chlamydiia bacterium]|nr:trp operon repressor [Chlamydiia bacterium]
MENDWTCLVELFTEVNDHQQMEKLLLLILTINEREYLIDRYRIVRALLTTKLTQREIAEQFHVSIAKITAGSNELKRTPNDIKEILTDFISKRDGPKEC